MIRLLPIIISFYFSGCASISLTELSDAETTPSGKHVLEVNSGIGTDITQYMLEKTGTIGNPDNSQVFANRIFPFTELGYKFGLFSNFDVRVNTWTANFPFNIIGDSPATDVGVKLGLKYRLNEPDKYHNFALVASVSHYDYNPKGEKQFGKYLTGITTAGISAGIVYSYNFNNIPEFQEKVTKQRGAIIDLLYSNTMRSVYTGVKYNYLKSDLTIKESYNSHVIDTDNRTGNLYFVNHFIGFQFGIRTIKSFEVHLATAKNELTNQTETYPVINFGFSWKF